MYYIYILKLENNKYYIGKTETIRNTIYRHYNGLEVECTKVNKPIITINIIIEVYSTEIINTIKRYVHKFGRNNVYFDNIYDKYITDSPLFASKKPK
jgi:hypothetical protein